MLNASCTELLAAVRVLHADLDQLAGRYDQAAARLRSTAPPAAGWTRQLAEWIGLRLESSVAGSSVAPWTARAGVDVAADALSSVRAMIARGSRSRDRELLGQAARRAASLGFPIEACEAELALLEATLAAGRPVDDDQQRDLADRLWQLGVHGWDHRLAAVAARAVRTGEADLSRLSQAERRVADAVGQGMTNREAAASLFLSVKTVDFHLQQIYRKLAVRSRTELAVLLHGDDHRARALAVR
jgi:DNA-binding CsgD family transcriptional regulator